MNYTHDPKKLAQNVAKHGVWFDIAEGFDWERAIVVFKKDVNNGGASDWWDRVALLLGQHSGYNNLKWSSATAHDDPYSSSPNRGQQGAHPRVFPGMYHHAVSFNNSIHPLFSMS